MDYLIKLNSNLEIIVSNAKKRNKDIFSLYELYIKSFHLNFDFKFSRVDRKTELCLKWVNICLYLNNTRNT